jgi:uncharacterized protein
MTTKKEIIKKIEKEKEKLKKVKVKKIGLFGSYVKGNPRENSDIDFIIEFKEINADNYFSVLFLLQKMFNKKIDLVIESDLKPELKYVLGETEYAKI